MEADVKLTFDSILPLVLDASDVCWRRLHVEETSIHDDSHDQKEWDALCVLRHGKTWKHIHGYFSNLEFRKCCLSLRGKPTQFNNIRLVSDSFTGEEGAMGRIHKTVPTVDKLNDKEFTIYGQALLCAQFPRLCVSTPSGSTSPELYSYASELRTDYSASATESLSLTSDPDDATASVIPTETLCEILRLAFGITRERAAQYEIMVYEQYKRKTREKILVEELMSQLSFLENNKHPFYNSSTFLSKGAYEQWQQLQRQHVMALINKIWHFTLPPLKGSIHYDPAQFHENYKILMEKMVRFESSSRPEDIGAGPVISSPLSTAALRLLKEYGLRYGVGEQYRRLVYLEYLADHFEYEVWYIQHLHSVLEGLLDGLPSLYSRAVMVQHEYDMFVYTSQVLHGQCENSLTRIRRLFTAPTVNPAQGVASLLELLALTSRLKGFLQDKSQEPMDTLLTRYTKKSFITSYERHKLIAVTDLQLSALDDQITPKLISRMIIAIRDEVKEYKDVFSTVYDRYLDVAKLAAETFYSKLLEDVRVLCSNITPSQQNKEEEILPLLALVYKLDQLDSEWASYITLGDQIWRGWIVPQSLLWMELLRKHSRQFIMQAVCADKFEPVKLKNKSNKPKGNRGRTHSAASTITVKSLSQSEHSAFTPVKPPQQTTEIVASTSRATEVTPSLARRLPFVSERGDQGDIPEDSFQAASIQFSKTKRLQQMRSTSKSGMYIAKSLSSPELFSLKNYAHSINKLQSNISKFKRMHTKSYSDMLQLRDEMNKSICDAVIEKLPKKSSSIIRSLPGSLGSDNYNNLMESGNFTFMRKAKQAKQHAYKLTEEFDTTPMKKNVASSHSTKPADNLRNRNQTQPTSSLHRNTVDDHVEIIGVGVSSHNPKNDITGSVQRSDSETDYEEVDSNYTESSADDEDDSVADGDEQGGFPPLTAIETSWNGSLGSLCIDEYIATEQAQTRQIQRDTAEVPRDDRDKAVVHIIGTRGNENETNSPGSAFRRITKLTSQMLEAHVKRSEKQKSSTNGKKVSTPISSSRSTPTVHWDPVTVTDSSTNERKLLISGSLVDVSCLIHRLISFAGTLCKTLCPLPWVQDMDMLTDKDVNVLQRLLHARKDILNKLLQTVWLIVIGYANNLLAFDLCGEVEKKVKMLVDSNLVDEVKNEHKAGYIWGCRHQQRSTSCNEFINKKAVYLADRFEPISETMCTRLNNVWSLLGTLDKFQEDAHSAVELENMKVIINQLKQHDPDDILDGYDIVEFLELPEHQERQQESEASGLLSSSTGMAQKPQESGDVIFEQSTEQLNISVEGLANLLAYRINLFFTEALHLLLSIHIPGVSLTRRLVPATEFLHNHLVTLHETLYQPCYNLLVGKLWTLVVKDLELELDDLSAVHGYTTAHAKELLEVVACYLRFFKNHAPEIEMDVFAAQTEDVCERLQLHTLSTNHLVKVHRRLQRMSQVSLSETESTNGLPSKECIEVMRKHLHAQRKTFSGSTLVRYFMSNMHMFNTTSQDISDEDFLESTAEKIAQSLLEAGIIVCNEEPVQTSHPSESVDTSMDSVSPYPAMGIYSSPNCSASLHKRDAFSQIFRKTSASMAENSIPCEDEEPLTFGHHPQVIYAGGSAKKLIERRKAARQRKEQKLSLSSSLPDIVNESSVLMFSTSSPDDVLSQSFDATLLHDKEEDRVSPVMCNGGLLDARSYDKLDICGTNTTATTASPSVVSHVSHASFSSAGLFQNSDDQFYRFAGQFDELMLDLDAEDDSGTSQSDVQSEQNSQILKLNDEWYKGKKITTEFLLNILNTRKSVDPQARCYLQSLPENILLAANVIAQHPPVVGCFGFIRQ